MLDGRLGMAGGTLIPMGRSSHPHTMKARFRRERAFFYPPKYALRTLSFSMSSSAESLRTMVPVSST